MTIGAICSLGNIMQCCSIGKMSHLCSGARVGLRGKYKKFDGNLIRTKHEFNEEIKTELKTVHSLTINNVISTDYKLSKHKRNPGYGAAS